MKAICAPPASGVCGGPALDLGDEVAERRLTPAVLGAVAGRRPVEGAGDLAEHPRTQDVGLGEGGVDDGLHGRVHRVERRRREAAAAVRVGRRAAGSSAWSGRSHRGVVGRGVVIGVGDGEDELVEVRAVLARRDDRTVADEVVVRQVRVSGDDRVDVGVDALDDPTERGVVGRCGDVGGRGALVDEQDDQVGSGGLERVGCGVGLGDDAAHLDVGDAGRADQGRQVLGDGADEAHVDPTGGGRHPRAAVGGAGRGRHVREGIGVVGPLADVGREVLPVGATLGIRCGVVGLHHPVDEVGVARVELVVAGSRDGKPRLVEDVERGLVVLDERLERGGADHVARGGEHRVGIGGPELLDGTRHDGGDLDRLRVGGTGRPVGQTPVEVVGRKDLDVDDGRCVRRRSRGDDGEWGGDEPRQGGGKSELATVA